MNRQSYQDVMWLFQEFGRHLQALTDVRGDSRTLLRAVCESHAQTFVGGRNPFNWLKELQSVLNFWHHLSADSDVPPDDIWRDLDTLERVVAHLGLDSEFIENVRDVRRSLQFSPAETAESGNEWPGEEQVRAWIREEVAAQLTEYRSYTSDAPITGHRTNEPQREDSFTQHGEIAERVRQFVLENYIEPARAEGQAEIGVRAGDVDRKLGFRYRRLPLICTALRSSKFLDLANVLLVGESGPPSGASTTTTFLFRLRR